MKFAFYLSFLLFSSLVNAENNPVKLFEEKASTTFESCSALISLQLMAKSRDRIKPYCGNIETVEEVKSMYKIAKEHLESEGNNGGIEQLKNYYAYWKTSMEILMPESFESDTAYKDRISKRKMSLKDKGTLLEVEADY
tara:strand:+ start:263 stop:679 length:417 start_codon:yes stop_codon:yes gene_type:complete